MLPLRVIEPPLVSVKHGRWVLLLQQSWLRPPLESTQIMLPGFVGSSTCETQARPVHVEPQPAPPHESGCGGTPRGSPACAGHGGGPTSGAAWPGVGGRE